MSESHEFDQSWDNDSRKPSRWSVSLPKFVNYDVQKSKSNVEEVRSVIQISDTSP